MREIRVWIDETNLYVYPLKKGIARPLVYSFHKHITSRSLLSTYWRDKNKILFHYSKMSHFLSVDYTENPCKLRLKKDMI